MQARILPEVKLIGRFNFDVILPRCWGVGVIHAMEGDTESEVERDFRAERAQLSYGLRFLRDCSVSPAAGSFHSLPPIVVKLK